MRPADRSAWASARSDQSSQCARWVAEDRMFLHADSESDQTGWKPRLIWVFAERTGHFIGFVMRWLISFHTKVCKSWYVWRIFFIFPFNSSSILCGVYSDILIHTAWERFCNYVKVRWWREKLLHNHVKYSFWISELIRSCSKYTRSARGREQFCINHYCSWTD